MVQKIKAPRIDSAKVCTNRVREAYFAIADNGRKQGIPFAGGPGPALRAGIIACCLQVVPEPGRRVGCIAAMPWRDA